MFDDILGNKKGEIRKANKDEIIKALKYNIKMKQELIEKLSKRITELERQLEIKEQDICTGI